MFINVSAYNLNQIPGVYTVTSAGYVVDAEGDPIRPYVTLKETAISHSKTQSLRADDYPTQRMSVAVTSETRKETRESLVVFRLHATTSNKSITHEDYYRYYSFYTRTDSNNFSTTIRDRTSVRQETTENSSQLRISISENGDRTDQTMASTATQQYYQTSNQRDSTNRLNSSNLSNNRDEEYTSTQDTNTGGATFRSTWNGVAGPETITPEPGLGDGANLIITPMGPLSPLYPWSTTTITDGPGFTAMRWATLVKSEISLVFDTFLKRVSTVTALDPNDLVVSDKAQDKVISSDNEDQPYDQSIGGVISYSNRIYYTHTYNIPPHTNPNLTFGMVVCTLVPPVTTAQGIWLFPGAHPDNNIGAPYFTLSPILESNVIPNASTHLFMTTATSHKEAVLTELHTYNITSRIIDTNAPPADHTLTIRWYTFWETTQPTTIDDIGESIEHPYTGSHNSRVRIASDGVHSFETASTYRSYAATREVDIDTGPIPVVSVYPGTRLIATYERPLRLITTTLGSFLRVSLEEGQTGFSTDIGVVSTTSIQMVTATSTVSKIGDLTVDASLNEGTIFSPNNPNPNTDPDAPQVPYDYESYSRFYSAEGDGAYLDVIQTSTGLLSAVSPTIHAPYLDEEGERKRFKLVGFLNETTQYYTPVLAGFAGANVSNTGEPVPEFTVDLSMFWSPQNTVYSRYFRNVLYNTGKHTTLADSNNVASSVTLSISCRQNTSNNYDYLLTATSSNNETYTLSWYFSLEEPVTSFPKFIQTQFPWALYFRRSNVAYLGVVPRNDGHPDFYRYVAWNINNHMGEIPALGSPGAYETYTLDLPPLINLTYTLRNSLGTSTSVIPNDTTNSLRTTLEASAHILIEPHYHYRVPVRGARYVAEA